MTAPADGAVRAVLEGTDDERRLALHPYVHWTDAGGVTTRGRTKVLALLAGRALLRPAAVELRDGQVYRWTEASA